MKVNSKPSIYYILILSLCLNSISFELDAQDLYSGVVIDENSSPIIGASVFLKNSTIGTQTDFNGSFNLKAEINDTIVISYIGFEDQEFNLTYVKDLVIINLIENIYELNEVIVVGY